MSQIRLDGRVAVVTGGGRGLGRAHALLLAERGAKVVVNATSTESAKPVAEEVCSAGGEAVAHVGDISLPTVAGALVGLAVETFGRIDIVVNNAGITYKAHPFLEGDLAGFEQMWRVHVGGTVNVTQAAWPHFVEQGYGRVVNMGSQAGVFGQPRVPEYCAAKGALYGLTRSLSFEGAEHGIAVNLVIPAGLSRMTDGKFPPEMLAAMRPELVSAVVVWLASPACRANGQSFGALAGRVGRFAIAETAAFQDQDLTPEDVADKLAEVSGSDPVLFVAGEPIAFSGSGQGYVIEILTQLTAESRPQELGAR